MKWLIPCLLFLIIGCREGQVKQNQDDYLFKMLSVEESGIDHFYGALPHAALEGGGVGVGDFNQDGLQDVFFVGDSIHGLYENIGALKFENRIELSGIPAIRGVGPVVVYDINKDQLPDIILGRRDVTNNPLQKIIHGELDLEKRESNLTILINQGNFNFKEEEEYQIKVEDAIGGISLADFDKNGLLDIALSSWNVDFEMLDGVMLDFERDFKSDSICTVKLFLQFEGGKFIEECTKVGVTSGGRVRTSYSNICTDINSDSRIDLIVTNDFDFPDQWYINQGNSEFKRLEQEIQNMPFFSMGIDAADVNNDGLIDVFITDMRPSGYYRQKTVKYDKSFNWLDSEGKVNLTSQQVRNHFYINQGETQFSEIAEMTGMDGTEWSWSVLLADFNNNEHKDVFVGNGYFLQDLMRHDSPLYIDSIIKFIDPEQRSIRMFDDTVTKSYFKNFFYANQGNLDFKDASQEWFMGVALNTRGAAYADLDNDGDLDLIFNNAKQRSCILQNTSIERDSLNFFRVQLISDSFEPLHSKCYIYYNNQIQLNEFNPIRGFYSSSEPILHFGLGKVEAIDSLVVVWTNGLKTTIIEPLINQTIVVSFQEEEATQNIQDERAKKVFVQEDKIINYLHTENVYNDFKQNLLLPQKYSTFGPYFALGDLSGNGLEDFVIGGALNAKAVIYYQLKEEEYRIDSIAFEEDIEFEDAGVIIFDINDDGLNDVFIAAGGNEEAEGNKMYTHRYYINQGNGVFIKHFLEGIQSSASALKLIEINAKQYLIVAGRLRPWAYPLTPTSYVLGYENGQFVDVTESIVPGLSEVGMVTDILCTDFNQDSQEDLIVVGEYMKPVFFQNTGAQLEKTDLIETIDDYSGLWNCIVEGDFNGDGFPDYIIGNLGENTRYKPSSQKPLEIYANDFDDNGSLDVITGYYDAETLYPVKHLHTFKSRINGFSKTYFRTDYFAKTGLLEMFPEPLLEEGFHAEARTLSSICLMSDAQGSYKIEKLPFWAQVSPIMDMEVWDYNMDGFDDVIIAGNFYHAEIERGIYDGHKGLILEGSKEGIFKEVLPKDSGLWLLGEVRSLVILNRDKAPIIIALINDGRSVSHKLNKD